MNKTYLEIAGDIEESLSNGPGLRYVLFVQGCPHHCDGCHNPHTWEKGKGTKICTDDLYLKIADKIPLITGVTISGGEPFDQPAALLSLILRLKTNFPKLNIWCYTGYRLEDLKARHCLFTQGNLKLIDTIVDGKFERFNQANAPKYTGSANQRVINLK